VSRPPRVAAIDIGTNSVLLLIVEKRGDELVPIVERSTITRLGQGVDRTRTLSEDAIRRTLDCLTEYQRDLSDAGVDVLDVVGTSAMRDAEGGGTFRERAKSILGVAPRVIAGDDEARLTYEGGLSGLDATGPCTVFDVGGGSTEIIRGDRDGAVMSTVSLDIGCVRLTERHLTSDPPNRQECVAAEQDADHLLQALPPPDPAATLVGVAGTMTTLTAIRDSLDPYVGSRVHGARLTADELDSLVERLASTTLAARRDIVGLAPKRADGIVAGALIIRAVLRWARADAIVVSDRGVRWGLVLASSRR